MGTRQAWARNFLQQLGNNGPNDDIVRLVSAWTRVENTKARYNPLATTLQYGHWTTFNTANVKNYSTYYEGIEASAYTLDGDFHGYPELKRALQSNDAAGALGSGGFDTWGSGSGKVQIAYAAGGFVDEELLSDTGTPAESGITPEEADKRQGEIGNSTSTEEQHRSDASPIPSPVSVSVSEEDIRNIAKSMLGILFIVAGVIMAIVALMKTDAAQTAAKVAIKGALL
jgi:hypothetical protein